MNLLPRFPLPLAGLLAAVNTYAQATAFTYQGRLTDGSSPASPGRGHPSIPMASIVVAIITPASGPVPKC
ncbi:MAG TPA: hypothetical protein VF607_12750 [Verrucomicrobiae bacterium]